MVMFDSCNAVQQRPDQWNEINDSDEIYSKWMNQRKSIKGKAINPNTNVFLVLSKPFMCFLLKFTAILVWLSVCVSACVCELVCTLSFLLWACIYYQYIKILLSIYVCCKIYCCAVIKILHICIFSYLSIMFIHMRLKFSNCYVTMLLRWVFCWFLSQRA